MSKCVLAAALALLVFAGNILAVDANQPAVPKEPAKPKAPARHRPVTVIGTVTVTKDKDGQITEAKLTTAKNTFQIVLDAKGKELAEKFVDKKAEVTGMPETKEKVKWLTVEKFGEATVIPPPKMPTRPKT